MNKCYGVAAGAALVLILQGMAWAGDQPDAEGGEHHGMLEKADTNKDGKLSYDESKAFQEKRMQERFKKMDANNDGFVDKDEVRKGREMRQGKMRERMEKRREMKDKPQ